MSKSIIIQFFMYYSLCDASTLIELINTFCVPDCVYHQTVVFALVVVKVPVMNLFLFVVGAAGTSMVRLGTLPEKSILSSLSSISYNLKVTAVVGSSS